MNRLKVSKAAVAASTAVLMVSSLMVPVTSASGANRINLSPDKNIVKPGDRVSLSVDYVPSDSGVAGFTIDVHYDPTQLGVFIPAEDMSAGSAFSVITNTDSELGTIKIVGADMGGMNVDESTHITTLFFDVKNTASGGSLNYWIDVENMVCDTSAEYVNADYSVPTESSPVTVKIDAPTKQALSSTEGELIPITSESEQKAQQSADETTAETVTVGEKENEQAALVTQAADEGVTYEKSDTSEHIYSYNDSGSTQYVFKVSDLTDKTEGSAKIEAVISSESAAAGAIGVGTTDGEWAMFEAKSTGDAVWTADVDLAKLNGTGAVQFFSAPASGDIEIKSVTITPYEAADITEAVTVEADDTADTQTAPAAESEAADTTDDNTDTAVQTQDTAEESAEKQISIADDTSGDTAAQTADDEQSSETATAEKTTKPIAEKTMAASETNDTTEVAEGSASSDKTAVTEMVDSAAAQANTNPKTGNIDNTTNVIKFILIMLSTCVLVYSGVAVALNKLVFDKKQKASR